MNQANKDLLHFILNVYPERGIPCHSSWTNGSLCATPEEELLHKCFVAQTGQDCPNVDYFEAVPRLLMEITLEAGIYPAYDADTDEEIPGDLDKIINFARDFLADSFYCHVRDY